MFGDVLLFRVSFFNTTSIFNPSSFILKLQSHEWFLKNIRKREQLPWMRYELFVTRIFFSESMIAQKYTLEIMHASPSLWASFRGGGRLNIPCAYYQNSTMNDIL